MVALPLRLYVGGVTILINISVQAPRCLIMSIYKHRITSTVKRNIVRQGYDSESQKPIWEHPPRVMRRRIGWYVCHPSPGCSRFRMAAFSLMESLGGYGGQKTLSPSTHVSGTISVSPLLNFMMHHWAISFSEPGDFKDCIEHKAHQN